MGKNAFKKEASRAMKIVKEANKQIIRNQCKCPHQISGYEDLDVVSKGDKRAFKCASCGKIIPLNAPSNDATKDAADVLDSALDYLKISINSDSEKGKETLETVAKIQYELRRLVPAFLQLRAEGEKKKSRNKKGRRDGAIIHYD